MIKTRDEFTVVAQLTVADIKNMAKCHLKRQLKKHELDAVIDNLDDIGDTVHSAVLDLIEQYIDENNELRV